MDNSSGAQFTMQGGKLVNTAAQSGGRAPGSGIRGFIENLLPVAGATLGTLLAPETGGLSELLASAILGGAGSSVGKIGENAIQHGKSDLLSGVGGQALLGAAGGAVGGALEMGSKALGIGGEGGMIGKFLGTGAKEEAPSEGAETATLASKGNGALTPQQSEVPTTGIGKTIYDKGSSARASVRNVEGVMKDEGIPASQTASKAGEINQWADNYTAADGTNPFSGSATKQLRNLPKVNDEINTRLNNAFANDKTTSMSAAEVKQNIADAVHGSPNYIGSTAEKYDNAVTHMNQMVDKEAETNAKNPDGTLNSENLNNIKKSINNETNFRKANVNTATPSDVDTRALRLGSSKVRGMITDANPEASAAIKEQQNAEILGNALRTAGRATSGRGTTMMGLTGPRVRLPGGGGVIQSVQDAAGRALQEVGKNPGGAVGAGLIHQGMVRGLIEPTADKIVQQQQMDKLKAQGITPESLGQPSPEITQALSGVQMPGASGLPSVAQIQQAEVQDMETTGGKNMAQLQKLQTLAASQGGNTLTDATVKQLSNYQTGLGMISQLAQAFGTNANAAQLSTYITDVTKQISTLTGISGKTLQSMLPSPTDSPSVALEKLATLKQQMDSQVGNTLNTTINSSSTNSASYLDDLLSSLQSGGTSSSVPSPLTALPGQS